MGLGITKTHGRSQPLRAWPDLDGVSLPGLVLKYLMKGTESDFYLFDEEDK